MKRLPTNILGISLLAVAGSVLAVGVVWASGSALRDGSGSGRVATERVATADSTVPDDSSDGDLPPVDPGDPGAPDGPDGRIDELIALVNDLSDQVDGLADTVAAQTARISRVERRITEVEIDFDSVDTRWAESLAKVEAAAADIEQAKSDAADAVARVNTVGNAVTVLERRASRLTDDGTYTGTINPSQFSRRLTPNDVSGDWPLDRTTGMLRSSSIEVSVSGCWSDSRYHTVLSVDPFRRLECLRIAK